MTTARPNAYLAPDVAPPAASVEDQLAEVEDAIGRTKVPGVSFAAGVMGGAVYFHAYVVPRGAEVLQGIRGRYHWYKRSDGPIPLQLYRAAMDAYDDLVRQRFTFDGHTPYAKVG